MATAITSDIKPEIVTIDGMQVRCDVTKWCGLWVFTTQIALGLGQVTIQRGMEFAGWNRKKAVENAEELVRAARKATENCKLSLPCFILFRGRADVTFES